MSTADLVLTHQSFITAQVRRFRETLNLLVLIKALILVIRQRRTLELLYGGYCRLFHRPSRVASPVDGAALRAILNEEPRLVPQKTRSRAQLIELYGPTFRVAWLPRDFQGARPESIWQEDKRLIIGEYGESSRIAYVTPESCVVSDYYLRVPGVRHIHSIAGYENSGEFFVSTGDSRKFLDLWVARNGQVSFVRRLRKNLAGFTATAKVNGEYYFGTDFSSRPNFIETLGGAKYFFPPKAYRLYVIAFHSFFDRYLVSINSELKVAGGRKTLSIFDTVTQEFIFCEHLRARRTPRLSRAA